MVVSFQIHRVRNNGFRGWRRGVSALRSLGNKVFTPGVVDE